MDSFIRWAGSKRQLLSRLRQFWPGNSTRYIEPFCGSACLFFDLEPKAAVLGDLNPELITTYRAIRLDATLVLEVLKRFPRSKKTYYRLRKQNPELLSDVERAARFLFLNRLCFNGIYRTNTAGNFNVPYAPPRGKWRFKEEEILSAQKLLQNVTLLNSDFATTMDWAERGDFVYIDPPYAVEKRRIFSEYHKHSFGTHDLERLQKALFSLDSKGVQFLVSYADSREARALLKPWTRRRIWAKRHIAGFASSRRGAFELLATNLEGITL